MSCLSFHLIIALSPGLAENSTLSLNEVGDSNAGSQRRHFASQREIALTPVCLVQRACEAGSLHLLLRRIYTLASAAHGNRFSFHVDESNRRAYRLQRA